MIQIIDMEKPNHCLHCPMCNGDDECVLIQEIDTSKWDWEEQYANCPLQEVEPECKKGKWIATYSDCDGDVWVSWKCSNCGYVRKKGWKYTDDGKKPDALFCEICGADMRGEQE